MLARIAKCRERFGPAFGSNEIQGGGGALEYERSMARSRAGRKSRDDIVCGRVLKEENGKRGQGEEENALE